MKDEEFNIEYNDVESELKELRKLCSQRGAKMQILFSVLQAERLLKRTCNAELENWFDNDGIPL